MRVLLIGGTGLIGGQLCQRLLSQDVEVHALLRSTRLDLAQRILGTRMANVTYTEDAWTLITVRYPDVESVRQLLYLGDHIRILNPAEAVEQFHDLAAQIMRAHSTNSSTNVSG